MSTTPNGHTYLFLPGRWGGKGTIQIIGGPTEIINLEMIISQSGTGTITLHMEVDFDESNRSGGVELVYTIVPTEDNTFEFIQYNSQLGELFGNGNTTDDLIQLNYQSKDGSFCGYQALERIEEARP